HDEVGGGGDEGKRRREHLVAAPDAERGERQAQRVGAGADADGVPRAAHLRQLGLQRAALAAEHELASVEHALGGGHQLAPERGVLPSEVEERDHRWPPDSMAPRPTRVLMGPLTPRRLSVKRISSSRLWRLVSSMLSAQHWQCRSKERRFSTKVVV